MGADQVGGPLVQGGANFSCRMVGFLSKSFSLPRFPLGVDFFGRHRPIVGRVDSPHFCPSSQSWPFQSIGNSGDPYLLALPYVKL